MLGRFFITASVAAMLSAAPAFAQQEGQPIIKPPAGQGGEQQPGKQGGGQEMQGSQQMPQQQNEAQGNKKLIKPEGQDQGQAAGKKQEPAEGQTATGAEGGQTMKKKKKAQQQPDEATGGQQQQQAGDNQAPDQTKKKKAQQGQEQDQMTTGSTGKVDTEITAEKKTVIREKIVTKSVTRVERDDIDFDISIGVVVPTTIALHPLPPDVIEVVPAYSGYMYFVLADGTIVIVEPGSLHIVYVLTA